MTPWWLGLESSVAPGGQLRKDALKRLLRRTGHSVVLLPVRTTSSIPFAINIFHTLELSRHRRQCFALIISLSLVHQNPWLILFAGTKEPLRVEVTSHIGKVASAEAIQWSYMESFYELLMPGSMSDKLGKNLEYGVREEVPNHRNLRNTGELLGWF